MGLFSIVLLKQQQMPCDDNKAPSWKSGRKTKEKNWKSGIPTFENSRTTGTGRDVLLSPTLRVFIRRMIWTFTLGRNSFCVRFVTQLEISKISIKASKEWTLMFSLWGCLSDTWFWKFIFGRNCFCVRFLTELQISKISIKTSKE